MNPLENFLELRPEIESKEEIIKNLRIYAFTYRSRIISERLLPCAKTGHSHTHFRIGNIRDNHLLTREHYQWTEGITHNDKRNIYENYIESMIKAYQEREENDYLPVPLVGGVIARTSKGEHYFLVIADLSKGGSIPLEDRGFVETLESNNKTYLHSPKVLEFIKGPPKYMTPENCIILNE